MKWDNIEDVNGFTLTLHQIQTSWTTLIIGGGVIKWNFLKLSFYQIYQHQPSSVVLTILVLLVLMIRYEVYGIRWMVLLSVTLLNLSNNALWISYASVAPVSADYFDKDINTDIDLLSTISFYVGIPMCIISTYVVDALGFKTGQLLDENKG